MKDVVIIEIDAPVEGVARHFTDPTESPGWMEDTRYEPLAGEQGAPGSRYRLVFNGGKMAFTVTVLSRDLPKESRLLLEASNMNVQIKNTFTRLALRKTLLVSEEVFTFRGVLSKAVGLLARRSIRSAHRRQMQSFKRFAEAALADG